MSPVLRLLPVRARAGERAIAEPEPDEAAPSSFAGGAGGTRPPRAPGVPTCPFERTRVLVAGRPASPRANTLPFEARRPVRSSVAPPRGVLSSAGDGRASTTIPGGTVAAADAIGLSDSGVALADDRAG